MRSSEMPRPFRAPASGSPCSWRSWSPPPRPPPRGPTPARPPRPRRRCRLHRRHRGLHHPGGRRLLLLRHLAQLDWSTASSPWTGSPATTSVSAPRTRASAATAGTTPSPAPGWRTPPARPGPPSARAPSRHHPDGRQRPLRHPHPDGHLPAPSSPRPSVLRTEAHTRGRGLDPNLYQPGASTGPVPSPRPMAGRRHLPLDAGLIPASPRRPPGCQQPPARAQQGPPRRLRQLVQVPLRQLADLQLRLHPLDGLQARLVHPSRSGQATLATLTWNASWWAEGRSSGWNCRRRRGRGTLVTPRPSRATAATSIGRLSSPPVNGSTPPPGRTSRRAPRWRIRPPRPSWWSSGWCWTRRRSRSPRGAGGARGRAALGGRGLARGAGGGSWSWSCRVAGSR